MCSFIRIINIMQLANARIVWIRLHVLKRAGRSRGWGLQLRLTRKSFNMPRGIPD